MILWQMLVELKIIQTEINHHCGKFHFHFQVLPFRDMKHGNWYLKYSNQCDKILESSMN